MTQNYEALKERHIEAMKMTMLELGEVSPQITLFGSYKNDPKPGMLCLMIPPQFLMSESAKDLLVDKAIPEIAKQIQSTGFEMEGLAWSSEANIRKFDKDEKIPADWKSAPISKEVLVINLQFAHKREICVYEIKRKGKQVNCMGDLVDLVELDEEETSSMVGYSGRLEQLYEKFKGAK